MKTKRTLAAFAALFVCALFTSCDMFEDYHSPEHQANLYANLTEGRDKKIIPNDSLEYRLGIDAKMRFVGKDSVEYSFVEVSHYKKAGDVQNDERTSVYYRLSHIGSPVLYFEHIDDTLFATTMGADSVIVDKDSLIGNNWTASVLATKQDWDNSNSNNDFFKHYTTTGSAAMRYAVAKTDTCAGYEVDFERPTYELTESTSYQDVTGVVYNNKTWEAVMRTSEVVATSEIPKGFRMAGEAFQKPLSVKNVAYFLRHVVNTDAEGINYEAKFKAQGAELTTEIQKVSGSLVTRDNDEVSKSEDFALNINLEASMSQPDDVQVTSEEALSNLNFTHRLGDFTESAPVAEGVFSKINFSAMDTIVLADTTITVVYAFEKYSWKEDFAYARIADREVRIESVKNEARSNNKVLVNTVTVYVDINVQFDGIDRPAEPYTVQVSYDRVYPRPDNYKTVYSWVGYFLKLIQENDSKVIAEQADTLHKVVTNNDELESSTFKAYNLDLYVSLEGGDTVLVDAPFIAAAQYVENHPNKAAYKGADEDGINVLGTSDSQTLKMKGGNTLNLKWYQESLTKDGKTVGQNATYNGTTANNITSSDLVMTDSSVVNGEIVKIYRQMATVAVNVNDPRNTASLAPTRGGNGSTGFSVSAPFYQKVVEPDELIPGSEEIVRIEEPDGKNIKVTDLLYETWKIQGRILKDEQTIVMFSELEGTDGSAIWVSNTNFVTTGAGLTCTGSGEYTNTSDNNYESYTNAFRYNVTDEKVFSLNGTNGVINDTVRGTMVITEKSYTIGEKTVLAGGIDEYVATSTIEGVYTVGSASVTHVASATKPLQEARAIPDCSTNETGRILAAYFTVVPGHWNQTKNCFEDAAGVQYAIKNMLVVYENGATAVPFAYETSDVLVPSADDILNGNFVAGDFTDDFNSGYYSQVDKKWIPAIASDTDGGINYATATNPLARPVRNESLNMWNWRNGNHSTQLTGYTCVVDENSGVLTVSYNGTIIFEGK